MTAARRSRSGASTVESIVAFLIVAVLIGLMIPAVTMAIQAVGRLKG